MSIRLMSSIWDQSPHSGTDLLMLLALADHANDDGVCWPSLTRLAARCRITKRQAINIIHKLEKAGDITIVRGGGLKHPSRYTVNGASHFTVFSKGETEYTVSKGEIQRAKGEIQRAKGEIAIAPESPREPSKESSEETLPDFCSIEQEEKAPDNLSVDPMTLAPADVPEAIRTAQCEQNLSGLALIRATLYPHDIR